MAVHILILFKTQTNVLNKWDHLGLVRKSTAKFRTKEQSPFKIYGIYVLVIHLYNFKEVALYILCKKDSVLSRIPGWESFQ